MHQTFPPIIRLLEMPVALPSTPSQRYVFLALSAFYSSLYGPSSSLSRMIMLPFNFFLNVTAL